MKKPFPAVPIRLGSVIDDLADPLLCCGEPMEHLGAGMRQCDPCGCLLTIKDHVVADRRRCPEHP